MLHSRRTTGICTCNTDHPEICRRTGTRRPSRNTMIRSTAGSHSCRELIKFCSTSVYWNDKTVIIISDNVALDAPLTRKARETARRDENGAEWYSLKVSIPMSMPATNAEMTLIFLYDCRWRKNMTLLATLTSCFPAAVSINDKATADPARECREWKKIVIRMQG